MDDTVESYFATMQAAFDKVFSAPEMVQPKTYTAIDVSRIPPKPWPWPRSMAAVEIAEYEALLGGEYRVTRGVVTARGDQVFGEPR